MISLFKRTTSPGKFHIRWRGYDREEVEEFLRQTAADRRRLEEGLAQLETSFRGQVDERRRESERLTRLRIEIASSLEASIGALRTATEVLARHQPLPVEEPTRRAIEQLASPRPDVRQTMVDLARSIGSAFRWASPAWASRGRAQLLAVSGLLVVLISAALVYRSSARELPADRPATRIVADQTEREPVSPAATAAPSTADGLVLALTANRQCWIRTHIDGGQPLERTLKAGETIMLRAHEEAILRVGDAGAISVLINNRQAKPLGPSGQVVTTRITRTNYFSLLGDNPAS